MVRLDESAPEENLKNTLDSKKELKEYPRIYHSPALRAIPKTHDNV